MRVVFGIVGLLVVVAIVGLLAKRELQATRAIVAPDPAASATVPTGTPAQQSQQLQRQVADDVGKALQQGMQRNADAAQ